MRAARAATAALLVAATMVIGTTALPTTSATTAEAAPNFDPAALYITSRAGTAQAPTNYASISTVDRDTGATATAYTVPSPTGVFNQLALSPGGAQMFWTNGAATGSLIYEYTPGGAAAPVLETVARPAAAGGTTMGGFNPANGLYYFGGFSNGSLVLNTYNPATNAVVAAANTFTFTSTPPGENGDIAFGRTGNLFFVAGGASSGQIYRVPAAAGSTAPPASAVAAPLGTAFTGPGNVNSIAFGGDGYLYVYASAGTVGLTQINPSSGAIVDTVQVAGAATNVTDLASAATPSSISGQVTLPGGRIAAGDQFTTTISGPDVLTGANAPTGTTTGAETGLQNQQSSEISGPQLTLPQTSYTVTQTAAGTTNLAQYLTTWQCVNTATSTVLSSGAGQVASATIPAGASGPPVVCTFTNTPGTASIFVDKTTTTTAVTAIGQTITYSYLIRNTGTLSATNVTLADPMPGLSAITCAAPGQGGTLAPNATMTCTATRTATAADFSSGTGTLDNTATVTASTARGNVTSTDTVQLTVDRAAPTPAPDSSLGNVIGQPVTVPTVGNDGTVVASSVRIQPPGGAPAATTYTAAGQGTWTVNTTTGAITFTPQAGFTGDPTPIAYSVAKANGLRGSSTVTVDYAPGAVDDTSVGNTIGQPVTQAVLANDQGGLVPGSVALVNPATGTPLAAGASLTVAGQGVWSIAPSTGAITFTPAAGYEGDPTPVRYRATDAQGNATSALVTVRYTPVGVNDLSQGNPAGQPVSLDVLTNDLGEFQGGSFRFVDPATGTPLAPLAPLTVAGQGTWSVNGTGIVTFTPAPGFLTSPTPVGYRVTGNGGTVVAATITVRVAPLAVNDEDLGNTIGDDVEVDVLANDAGTLNPATVAILDPATGTYLADGASLVVAGQGTWSIDAATGAITFSPVDGFLVDPTPITYRVANDRGERASATVTVTYVPSAADDVADDVTAGQPSVVEPLANDTGDFDEATFAFVDPATGTTLAAGAPLTVAGEGTWTVAAGVVTFTPAEGFEGDPSPVDYRVADVTGDVVGATISANVVPLAADDADVDNVLGEAVTQDVLANDLGVLDVATLALVDADGETQDAGASLTVAGEGTWSIAGSTITFTPEEGFLGDPTPIRYEVADLSGDVTSAEVVVGYVGVAQDDADLGNAIGDAVTVPVLANDLGVFDPATVAFVDPETGEALEAGAELVVAGEGTWTIDQETGDVTFTPEDGFEGDPTVVTYAVADLSGDVSQATITITYLPVAEDDEDLENPIGTAVGIDVLANDAGVFDVASLSLVAADDTVLAPGAALVVAGEGTWSIAGSIVTFTPEAGYEGDPTPVRYRVADLSGDVTGASITVDYVSVANDDVDVDNAVGTAVPVDVLANDQGDFDVASLSLVDADGTVLAPGAQLVVDGEGSWRIAGSVVTFTPARGFLGDPTPIDYEITDRSGDTRSATITVGYVGVAVPDVDEANFVGDTVTLPILDNDRGVFDPATVAFLDPATGEALEAGAALVVAGQGTWTIDPATGDVTFTPEVGYEGDPTVVTYQVADLSGDLTQATITVTYIPATVADVDEGNTIGEAVAIDVLENDLGIFDPARVSLIDPATGVTLAPGAPLTVAGEGVWTIDATTGVITFTPEAGYEGDPTVVSYSVPDNAGLVNTATITITYLPVAANDSALDNVVGTAVTIDVLANDAGVFSLVSLALVDADGTVLAPGSALTVPGQGVWTVDGSTVTFTPEEGFEGDPTPIAYEVADLSGDVTGASITVTYLGDAQDDVDLGNAIGDAVTVPVLDNDLGIQDPATVAFLGADGQPLAPGAELVVEGEGTWTIDPETGDVTFTPEDGFEGDPSVVTYQVASQRGGISTATITITYLPVAEDDADLDNVVGEAVAQDVLANDAGVFDVASLSLIAADDTVLAPGAPLTVDGEGTWTIDGSTVTFTPADGFQGDPTPIRYRVADLSGDVTSAEIAVGYVGVAQDDADLGNVIGDAVTVPVLANDLGEFDPATIAFVDPETGEALEAGAELVVDGEGTWTIDPETGDVTFTPEDGFEGDPTVVTYEVADLSGDASQATVTITYLPVAVDDADVDNVVGDAVAIDVLANDAGVFDEATLSLVAADGTVLEAGAPLVVAGEGTWTIDGSTVTFTPEEGFQGDPTPIRYEVADLSGDVTGAAIVVGYVGAAVDDESLGNAIGAAVAIDVLANDAGVFDVASLSLVAADGTVLAPGAPLVVAGEGTWSISGSVVTFTPEAGFEGDPTPIAYEVTDLSGDVTGASVTVGYLPVAADDADVDNVVGDAVAIDVLANDAGVFDVATLSLVDADGTVLDAGESLVVEGEGTWSIDGSVVTFTPEEGFLGDPTPIRYEVADLSGDVTGASITVGYVGDAQDDADLGNAIGDAVTVPVLDNDLGEFDPATVAFVDPATGETLAAGAELVVAGQGTWTIDPETGDVTFTPEDGFEGDPTAITYAVADLSGDRSQATITITYLPVALDDADLDNVVGAAVTIDVLANDAGVLDAATLALVDADGAVLGAGEPLVVDGEGTWTIDGATVTFTPEAGFEGDPTPIRYEVADLSGDVTGASIAVGYVGVAADDVDVDNVVGDAVAIDVLANDAGVFDVASLSLVDADGTVLGAGEPLVVDGEGTWTIDGATVTFTPEEGFQGDPTPIGYQVFDLSGDVTGAAIVVGYVGVAQDDEALDAVVGESVAIDVLANDVGVFDPATIALVDPATGQPLAPGAPLTVVGEGTWTIDGATVTFTPEAGFEGNPTIVTYRVADLSGDVSSATITITVVSVANDDADVDNVVGDAVAIDVLANDAGVFDVASLSLVDADGTVLDAGEPLVVDGEGTWSIDGATVTFTPEEGFLGDPTPIAYEVTDLDGDVVTASITVGYVGDAQDDADLGNAIGDAVTVPVLDNDLGEFDPATVAFVDPATGEALEAGAELVVDGEGAWTIDPETGDVTFTPEDGYEGDPTAITYAVADLSGDVSQATITITYLPVAEADESLGNAIGAAVAIDVLANDAGVFDVASLSLVAADGTVLAPGAPLIVAGEGTWTVAGATVTFTPEEGFQGDPTSIAYEVADLSGDVTGASITVGVVPVAADDVDVDNAPGTPVAIDVLANDAGVLDPATVALVDADDVVLDAGESLVVDGEGTWSIDPTTGAVTFSPEDGFLGDPTPIRYEVADLSGDVTRATITVGYVGVAVADLDEGNAVGDAVTVPVLDNDLGVFDPATIAFVDPATGTVLAAGAELVVAGEGTWTIDQETGDVTFTPVDGYEGDPTVVTYRVADLSGDVSQATITITYVPAAVADVDEGNTIGEPVSIDVLANDVGEFDPAQLSLIDPTTGTVLAPGASLTVAGEGVWSIDPETGVVTFTPDAGYEGDPTVVSYQVPDGSGDVTSATITITYLPVAFDDADLDNVVGASVAIDVLANDAGVLDVATLALIDAQGVEQAPGAALVVPGEGTWTIDGSTVTFTPEAGFEGNPTPVDYRVEDASGDVATATITVGYVGVAQPDADLGNAIGDAVTVPVLDNDSGAFDVTSVALVDPETGEALEAGAELVVDGEGTWTIDPETGDVTFTPEDGFEGDPTVVSYEVTDELGVASRATITITYLPVAVADESLENAIGAAVAIDVLANDAGVFDVATLSLVAADGTVLAAGEPLVVAGEGTWSISGSTVTFTPEAGFEGDPTPIAYEVRDLSGDVTGAAITVDYLSVANDDADVDNVVGEAVAIDVLANDAGDFDVASLSLVDADGTVLGAAEPLVVDGEGTWTIDGATVTFTPEEGFLGDPTPIDYEVTDASGDTRSATITVGYVGDAQDDADLGNAIGDAVTVPVLDNDLGEFDPATVAFVDPATGTVLAAGAELVVAGEGTWSIDPETGDVTFTPEDGFEGDPAAITYAVADLSGDVSQATITITYLPVAEADESLENAIGAAVAIDVLANDAGVFDVASLSLVAADGSVLAPGAPLVVAGEGTWSISGSTVTFTPEAGFEGDPTPIAYEVADLSGDVTGAAITVDYLSVANDDADVDNVVGESVAIDVLANDAGVFDVASLSLVDADGTVLGAGEPLVVDGEGTWTIDGATVTFTPEEGFQGDPTPIDYEVTDGSGDTRSATITVGYVGAAQDDADLGNAIGDAVTVPVLDNDLGEFDPATVAFVDPATGEALEAGAELVVDGEGTWTIDPETGDVTFTPEDGFEGDPTVVTYAVADLSGDVSQATITITYLPVAVADESLENAIGAAVAIDVLANDAGVFDVASLALVAADGTVLEAGAPLVVAGEGTWSIDGSVVTFTPEAGFEGDPTPIAYEVADLSGDVTGASITVGVLPVAADDADGDNVPGESVAIDVLANDAGVFDVASLSLVDADGTVLDAGESLVVDGEGTWSIEGSFVTFTPEEGFLGDPTPIRYEVADLSGDVTGASIAVGYVGDAQDDADLGNAIGDAVTVPVLDNDLGDFDPATVAFVDPATGETLAVGAELVVDGEGTWSIDPETGDVTFTPEDGFEGDPTVVTYEVADRSGDRSQATITVGYLPVAADDAIDAQTIGAPATIDVLANDRGDLDPATVALVDPATGTPLAAGSPLVVAGEGTWTIDPVTGAITFTPEAGFEGDPTPVEYRVADRSGDVTGALVTVDYAAVAAADESRGNAVGTPVTIDVLANDAGELDPSTVALVDPATGEALEPGEALVVAGEGTWTIDPATGAVTFTPVLGFEGDPTPIAYEAQDASGSATGAAIVVDYAQSAAADASLDQPIGQPVSLDVLANDVGDLDPATLAFLDPVTNEALAPGAPLVVAGEGTWTIDGATVTFTPEPGFLGDPTVVAYQVADRSGDVVSATITVTYAAVANDDESLANEVGTVVEVDVLANDLGDFDPATVAIVDPATGTPLAAGAPLVVAGEGTWSIDPATGVIAFTPEQGYGGDPTPIAYVATASNGDVVSATVTVTYGPTAVADASLRNAQGSTVVVDVLANDLGDFDPASVRIVGDDGLVLELVVPGEGTWTVDPETGAISFTPADGFTGNPTPITYSVTDVTGDVVEATVEVTYRPVAQDDVSSGNAPGQPVTVDPLANDAGELDPTTVEIRDPATGLWTTTVVVPGEGTWTVDPVTGAVTFTPEPGFTGSPTPIDYRVADVDGVLSEGTIVIEYDAVPPTAGPGEPSPSAPGAPGEPDEPGSSDGGLPRTGGGIALLALLAAALLIAAGWLVRRGGRVRD